jgi:dTDP-4-dehydrorhamnose reductase
MRILILGGGGMLGHKLVQTYRDRYDVYATVRTHYRAYAHYGIFDEARTLGGVDAFTFDTITRALAAVRPDVVINCIGIIKQLAAAQDPIISLTINSLLPHQLALLCQAAGVRLLHISTDCVFNGRDGSYTEDRPSNAEDLYGRTKFLGEVDAPGCLTLRTSIIGRELASQSGLVDWFLSNRGGGPVRGFRQAIYTGFTTLALAQIIADLLDHHPDLEGLYQVSSEPINKYDLLQLVNTAYAAGIEIAPDDQVRIDRSLDSSRFRAAVGFHPPAWPDMINAMAADPTPYDTWK